MSGPELAQGLAGARVVICNDYEFEIIRQKTGHDEAGVLEGASLLVVTKGEHGCSLVSRDAQVDVPAVPPLRIVDPTGVGDAFRGGFMKGLVAGADIPTCGRLGSVAAAYALEHLGGSSHAYTFDEFATRYEAHFGALGSLGAGATLMCRECPHRCTAGTAAALEDFSTAPADSGTASALHARSPSRQIISPMSRLIATGLLALALARRGGLAGVAVPGAPGARVWPFRLSTPAGAWSAISGPSGR